MLKATACQNYLLLGTVCWLDVVHDIDVDIVQNDALLRHSRTLPQDATKDDTCFGRGHLDRRLDALEAMRGDRVKGGSLDKLEVTQCRKVEAQVL